jgi:hypothetical protein
VDDGGQQQSALGFDSRVITQGSGPGAWAETLSITTSLCPGQGRMVGGVSSCQFHFPSHC